MLLEDNKYMIKIFTRKIIMNKSLLALFFKNKGRLGYTLLFAILISSIILAIGVSILGLARKELMLTLGAKESQVAIYAADDGLECAIYWDAFGAFGTSSSLTALKCHDITVPLTRTIFADNSGTVDFTIPFDNLRCAVVSVTKKYDSNALISNLYLQTTVDARGYNICGTNSKKVERYLQMIY